MQDNAETVDDDVLDADMDEDDNAFAPLLTLVNNASARPATARKSLKADKGKAKVGSKPQAKPSYSAITKAQAGKVGVQKTVKKTPMEV